VATEGGISKAADKLDMAVPTVGAQVLELECALGYALLKSAGRGLVLAASESFSQSLCDLPLLLPTPNTAARDGLDLWFEQRAIRPRVVGEFADSALLKTFGASGMGVFPAAECAHDDLLTHDAVKRLGPCEGVIQHVFAIGTEKKVHHPFVQHLLQPAL